MERRLEIKESAFSQFSLKCGATPAVKATIRTHLKRLATEPENGYPIPFNQPWFYQSRVDQYRIHYTFDDYKVEVLYIGKPGVC